ncbi:hypothetical protein FH972_021576 [Carpinus fangiana]|uniref:Uncharacterized protein n=1 Tax=Carpinus fangiana TaxID=176857 RepID=A0A5N6KQB7_9ROSI|nr:hypothetical protein FH972_021576 [Carpinus fangiana]
MSSSWDRKCLHQEPDAATCGQAENAKPMAAAAAGVSVPVVAMPPAAKSSPDLSPTSASWSDCPSVLLLLLLSHLWTF